MIDYPNKLENIFEKLNKNNIRAVIVGGYVRDSLLNINSKDIDIELYGISSLCKVENLLQEFGDTNSVGKSFGVCKLRYDELDLDFTLPREEIKNSLGHCGFTVKTNKNLNFRAASIRRDFTINAMGYDVVEKKLLDPFNGKKDLNAKILRVVNEKTFVEDPLRVLRAVQFSARFHLSIDKNLLKLSRKMVKDGALNELSKERIFDEIKKFLLKSQTPSIGLVLLKELHLFHFFVELQNLSEEDYHITLRRVDNMSKILKKNKNSLALMLVTLTSKLNKSQTLSFVSKLTNERKLIEKILLLKESVLNTNMSDEELYKVAEFNSIESTLLYYEVLYPQNKEAYKRVKKRAIELRVFNEKLIPLIQGRDLIKIGMKPSKEFAEILARAYKAQMGGEFKNFDEAILWLKKERI